MAANEKVPTYMGQLLEELGWDQGTRIPLADAENQCLETLLINRQNEIQKLKESLQTQIQKRNDLNKYKEHVHSEYQENTRLLFAHKQQLEQEVKLRQLSQNEASRLDRDIITSNKQCNDIDERIDRLQTNISRYLKKADSMKAEVCGERGALSEWRAALERSDGDISAIEQFTKQDLSKAKALETKRQKLKMEHDKTHERLIQLVANLSAEERACERISIQVMEGMEQRKQMMTMWTAAIENLRQRDIDIRHIREDYAVLEDESNKLAEQCREQQTFCDQQRGNNADADRENVAIAAKLSDVRIAYQRLLEQDAFYDSEAKSLQRELANMTAELDKLRIENRQIMDDQYLKNEAIRALHQKIRELKEKVAESCDKTKSSEKRANELEEILNEEERYANQLTINQQRAMHCSFVEQQKLLSLKNEEKLFYMQLKSSKAVLAKLDHKEKQAEKLLQLQKENLYNICYQVETQGSRLMYLEGAQAEREYSADLTEREARLKDVFARHAARVALLERHSAKLHDDMRRLTRELENISINHTKLQSRLKTSMLNVEGGEKQLVACKEVWRKLRVEEALMRLRVAHASRALADRNNTTTNLNKQRMQLDSAMSERLVEIGVRRDMFAVQKRALYDDCGKLKSDIRDREMRIEQLKKRYDIFMNTLGKDDSGQQLSVTFFKIKFAAERAELRERGAALDADIGRSERDISALEATLRVVQAAHRHLLRHVAPIDPDAPEMEELHNLRDQYFELKGTLKILTSDLNELEQRVNDLTERRTLLLDKNKQLCARETEAEHDVETSRDNLNKQHTHLENAREVVRVYLRRAKKLIENYDEWKVFQMALWNRDYTEAADNALKALSDICQDVTDVAKHLGALLASIDEQHTLTRQQKRTRSLIQRIVAESVMPRASYVEESSLFSSSSKSSTSGLSMATGYTRRLCNLRTLVSQKIKEPTLVTENASSARRSTVSLKVVTLGM